MIKILGEDLARICGNALMFCNPKSLYLPGEILFDLTDNTLKVYACDDYFAICSQASFTGTADTFFVLNLNDVKGYTKNKEKIEGLEEFARRNKKDEILILPEDTAIQFMAKDEVKVLPFGEYREDNWYIVEGLIFDPSVTPVAIQSFDSNPERYSKLSQLKYNKDEHWIKWKFVETETGNLLVRFTVGPDISGVIRPLSEPERHLARRKGTDDGTPEETQISIPD